MSECRQQLHAINNLKPKMSRSTSRATLPHAQPTPGQD